MKKHRDVIISGEDALPKRYGHKTGFYGLERTGYGGRRKQSTFN